MMNSIARRRTNNQPTQKLAGSLPNSKNPKHNINSIIPELEGAIHQLESELQLQGDEEAALLASLQQTVGSMSDLRYGRLANGKLPEEVLEGLANLHETCKGKN